MNETKQKSFHILIKKHLLLRNISKKGSKSLLLGCSMLSIFFILSIFSIIGPTLNLYEFKPNDISEFYETPPDNQFLANLFDHQEKLDDIFDNESNNSEYHLLGTDRDGRDIFIQTINGGITYILGGLIAIMVSLLLGIVLGSLKGYYKNSVVYRGATILLGVIESFPVLIVMLIIAFIANFELVFICIGIGIVFSSTIASTVSTKIEWLKTNNFIEAAKELGVSNFVIITKHILWYNTRQELLLMMVNCFSIVILLEATLGYLNFGISGEWISWGRMIYEGVNGSTASYLRDGIYWMFLPPAFAILYLLTCLHLVSEGLIRKFNIKE